MENLEKSRENLEKVVKILLTNGKVKVIIYEYAA